MNIPPAQDQQLQHEVKQRLARIAYNQQRLNGLRESHRHWQALLSYGDLKAKIAKKDLTQSNASQWCLPLSHPRHQLRVKQSIPQFEQDQGHLVDAIAELSQQLAALDILTRKQKKAEILLEEMEALAHVGCWRYLPKTKKVFWSKQCYRIFEVAADFKISLETSAKLYGKQQFNEIANYIRLLEPGSPAFDKVVAATSAKGNALWLRLVIRRLSTKADKDTIIGVVQDVTQQTKDNIALEKAKLKADQALTEKTQFLTTLSHEIRTPMNGILGASALLQHYNYGAEDAEKILSIHHSATALLDILNGILTFSSEEPSGSRLKATNVRALLENTKQLMLASANRKHIDLSINYGKEVPDFFRIDQAKLMQVIFNLLTNAIHYTENGYIKISALYQPDKGLSLTITDNGCGIDNELMQRIQTQLAQPQPDLGFAMGLGIAHKLCQDMQGFLQLTSTLGSGSCAGINLANSQPCAAPESAVNLATTQKQYRLNALLVEDNKVNQKIASRFLEKLGMQVSVANNGQQAVDNVQNNNQCYDVIFMDLQMPVMDGYTATLQLRSLPKSQHTPIVAMTANVLEADRNQCQQVGMNGFITKPVKMQTLCAVLDSVFEQH